jgi:O-glycosyl hydrolase
MTEVGCGGTESHNHKDMSSALELAKMIRDYLMEMNASAWVYWQVVENEVLNHNHGFIHANFSGAEEYWITKQYYAFANFSKFIKEGAVILDSNDQHIVVAYDERNGELILVLINEEDVEKEYSCDLTSFNNIGRSASVYRTSADENLAQLQNEHISDMILKVNLIAKSISTYIINSVEL